MFKINRKEERLSREGKPEMFISILINDDLGEYNFGHWLTSAEYEAYKANNDVLDSIAQNYLPQARANYEASLNTEELN